MWVAPIVRRNKNLHPVLWAPFYVAGLVVTNLPGKSGMQALSRAVVSLAQNMVWCLSRRRNPFLSGSHLNQTVVRRNIFTGYNSGKTKHIIENSFCIYVSISAIHENAENYKHSLKKTMGIINYSIKRYLFMSDVTKGHENSFSF